MDFADSTIDDYKPSLFEILSESQLSSLLAPTLRYLLALETHRHPRYLLRLLNSYDELHALVFGVLEHYYLRTYSASFTEHFYSLKRERVLRTRGGEVPRAQAGAPNYVRETLKLRRKDVWANLAVLVALPYIKRKLDEGYEIHVPPAGAVLLGSMNEEGLPEDATLRQRAMYIYKWFLRKVYPGVNAAYYFSILAFNLAYLFDASKYHSPWLWLINTRMRRMSAADEKAVEDAAAQAAKMLDAGGRPGQTSSIFSPRTFTRNIIPQIMSSSRFLLPASIFALKFLEWWHGSDFARQLSRKATEGLVLPPPVISGLPHRKAGSKPTDSASDKPSEKSVPPRPTSEHIRHAPISASTRLPIFTVPEPASTNASFCPICVQPIVTATATPYGYVYCYTCIHRWVEGTHERQEAFMSGRVIEDGPWAEDGSVGQDEDEGYGDGEEDEAPDAKKLAVSRDGQWENGAGRCAVTGKKILGGTEGLRRVVV